MIELAYFGGFSHAQIADALGLPAGTVKGRMRLALEQAADRARRARRSGPVSGPDPTARPRDCGNDSAPYVLGALEPAEARAFAHHMQAARCAAMRSGP